MGACRRISGARGGLGKCLRGGGEEKKFSLSGSEINSEGGAGKNNPIKKGPVGGVQKNVF